MALTYLGELTVGGLMPALTAAQAAALAELQGKLAGIVRVQASLTIKPPALAASIEAVAKVGAALALAIDGPTVSLQLTALGALVASLEAQIAALVGLPLGTAGIHAYAWLGRTQDFGPALTSALTGGLPGGNAGDETQGLVLAAREAASWSALSACMRTGA